MINRRQHFRLRMQIDITWSVPDQKIKGEGIILNISLPGMLFVTDRLFESEHGLHMAFGAAQVAAFPSQGKLVWFRKVGKDGNRYLCGVLFSNEASQSQAWIKWMEENILKLADVQNSKILERILSEGEWE